MIHEFALDPNAISDWQSFRFFIDQFGSSKGRLISRFPKKWKRMVYEALVEKKPTDLDRSRIEERLKNIDDRLLSGARVYEPELTWIANAVNQHSVKPFRAIITVDSSSEPHQITAQDVDETNSTWNVPTNISVVRTAEAMATAVGPLLEISSEIIFVDPYFDPERDDFVDLLKNSLSTHTPRNVMSKESRCTSKIMKIAHFSIMPSRVDVTIDCRPSCRTGWS
ncbi:MAG: hypothetical protein IPN51_06640 [Chloracidobacterium sp.]|nr:hypothetical protein [Chloracidobacterium sp.]